MPLEIAKLFTKARTDLNEGRLTTEYLDSLEHQVQDHKNAARQRLLYLHSGSPSIRSQVLAGALHEPVSGSVTQIDPLEPAVPYQSVFAAILDGWRVIHFPDQRAPFDDREIDIVGFEFILEKLENYENE